jgi:hypothetical protein
MGRPSKLSEKQWAEIEQRHLAGETVSDLAREYGIAKGNVSRRVSKRNATTKVIAKQIAEAEIAFSSLPIAQQVSVRHLADDLKAISSHLAGAASFGAMTAHRLSMIASTQVERIDESASLEENTEALKSVLAMTRGANDASQIGLNLLNANKETVIKINKGDTDSKPRSRAEFYE